MKKFVFQMACACLTAPALLLAGCHAGKKTTATAPETPDRSRIVAFARQQLGTPYRYGGTSPQQGFDCSGFVQYVYRRFGIALPRTSAAQGSAGPAVPLKRAQPADLIFFTGSNASGPIGHVGIILRAKGPDTEFIHAGSGARSGGVLISALSASYYTRRFVKVVRVL